MGKTSSQRAPLPWTPRVPAWLLPLLSGTSPAKCVINLGTQSSPPTPVPTPVASLQKLVSRILVALNGIMPPKLDSGQPPAAFALQISGGSTKACFSKSFDLLIHMYVTCMNNLNVAVPAHLLRRHICL